MGNYVSCTLTHRIGKHSTAIKVIFPNGEIRKYQEPVKAAELMMESPNSFVVDSKSLRIGTRFLALNADKDLEFASVYVMFPMSRVNSVVTTADLGSIFISAKKIGRIAPEVTPALPRLNLEEIEELSSTTEFKQRILKCRSKKPLLDTIDEEHVCTR
ncbi:hypothetical protein QVD17_04895 [Tagetes erecta]|uniref:Uncharacterized protein n=1 Tax=Tagetes erecta TaxID=13708 RepID=A0AAD8P4X6_TARER|nr:hypothetical protein QVD17_04895 [Tagetes erecta]